MLAAARELLLLAAAAAHHARLWRQQRDADDVAAAHWQGWLGCGRAIDGDQPCLDAGRDLGTAGSRQLRREVGIQAHLALVQQWMGGVTERRRAGNCGDTAFPPAAAAAAAARCIEGSCTSVARRTLPSSSRLLTVNVPASCGCEQQAECRWACSGGCSSCSIACCTGHFVRVRTCRGGGAAASAPLRLGCCCSCCWCWCAGGPAAATTADQQLLAARAAAAPRRRWRPLLLSSEPEESGSSCIAITLSMV